MVCLKEDIIVLLPTDLVIVLFTVPKILEKNSSFHFRRLENVCSCRIESNLVLPHSGNQPSLTEKFDIRAVYTR